MKDNQAKYPQLRFKGFTDPWDKRYLGDYVVDYTEKTTQENQFPVLTSSQQQGIVLQSEYFSDRQVTTDENIGYFVLPRGYFTYRSRSDNNIFVFNRNDIIDKGIISYFYPVFGLINADSSFFLRRINNGLNRQLAIAAEGTGQHVLSLKKFKKMETRFPSLPEQKQIGEFLECLDDLITVNQRKLAKLKELKQGYLQKLFPRNGSKFPQLRFAGFADAWEQRKLGNLGLNISDGDWIEKQHIFENGQYRIIQTGNIGVDEYLDKPQNAKYFRQEDFNQLKANEIFPGDIVVCRLADPAGRAVILPNIGKQMVTSVDVAILRPSSRISFRFLVSQLNNPRNLKQVQIMASGSTRTRISRKNLEREIIQLPNINEQKKIGSFFSILNSTIALHQRKLEKLQELKKGYLQKMFC
ncbi:restriction endonuclease subunit S [Lactiplantibacillus plantarum]|uniref:restriction endonuclease subunit S n=1 Tax=Lactiplantibacillus plantarum TaxID=1590 RepID=UPI001455E60D|nr:restriction endonuclease subunit S [Lactiplantibacillus plantarum]